MGAAASRASVGALGRGSRGFPSRRTLPRGLCQIVSPNPAFPLGRAAFSGPQERWPVQPPCLQCSDAAGNLIWADQGGPPHGTQAASTLISRRLNMACPPALRSPAARPPAHGGPSFLQASAMDNCRTHKGPGARAGLRGGGCRGREEAASPFQTGSCCVPPGKCALCPPAQVCLPYRLADGLALPHTQSPGSESARYSPRAKSSTAREWRLSFTFFFFFFKLLY